MRWGFWSWRFWARFFFKRLFCTTAGGDEDIFAVESEFFDGLFDIVESAVGIAFFRGAHIGGIPAADDFLDGGDVDDSVVQVGLELWHIAVEEAAVLPDGVATKGGGALIAIGFDELQGSPLRFFFGDGGFSDCFGEA